ncbi:adenylate/guanylate cyclase domain-containing protein [uncultured Treponema sp.]|uniref:adenylate/guanylate cyclase domain-containing protein n=1 Tax=uncultured Treponema sp. TaxID=162155 RepID=UPI0025E07E20|nr:adenylate/guanylate cyclase domain-containing protein [uncultured Treponema sp.]
MKKKGLLLFLILFSHFAFAQTDFLDNYVYQSWNSFDGLTGTTTTDIAQTKDGYLYIGTYEGLVRFDGVNFTTIRRARNNNLKFSSVRTILEDSNGNLWVGSNDEGVHKIMPDGTSKSFSKQNGLPNNSVRALCEDREGNIWIGTAAGVVYLTPRGHLITPQFQAGTVSKGIIAVTFYCDTAGRIWLITSNDNGLFVFSDGLFHTIPQIDKEFGNYFATSIIQDLSGTFWIAMGDSGLVSISNGNLQRIKSNTILDSIPTCSMYVANDGTILFGTERGVVSFHKGVFAEAHQKDLANAKINRIIRDREGHIWFASDRNGIGKLTHSKFNVTKLNTTVNSIVEDNVGRVWIGTDRGVRCYVGEKEITNNLTEETKDIRIRHIATTISEQILVSCYTKPAQLLYNPRTGAIKRWTTDDGLAGNKVRVSLETAPNEFYVGTTTGLSIIHADGTITSFKQFDGLENEYVMCLYKDSNGIIWIGTDGGGIYLMKNEAIIANINSEEGLIGNIVFKIKQDKDGSYWICTSSGISHIKAFDSSHTLPNSYENINSDNGIGTDSVFQIISDTSNDLWLTSNYGIVSVKRAELLESAQTGERITSAKYYTKNGGLDSNGPTSTSTSICDSHGRLWFAMVDGFAVYDPIKNRENSVTPLVHIESVTIDNIEHLHSAQEFILKPGTKRVVIKFTGLSFDAPERIQFQHQLTNFEESLSLPSTERTVSYTNISPGKHTFIVMAINGEGIPSEEAEAMLFVQKPYFYQMPVFWVISLIILIDIVGAIFYFKQRAIKLENIRLEGMVQARTRELAAEKDKSDQLLRAILPDKIADELKDDIHSVAEAFPNVTLLFSDIVSFTKVSSNHTANEIVHALNDLFTRFDERAKKMGVEKIKTIGDAYMAACGVPTPNKNHALIMVKFAKGMYEDLGEYNKTAQIQFSMRIGLNSGSVTAGVIGKTKFVYDVWGNTVNVASRMESACSPGQIRVSQTVFDQLQGTEIKFTDPIECDIKGKGKMITYEVVNNTK